MSDNQKTQQPFSIWAYFDNFSKLLAGLAFVVWMIEEWNHKRIFLFVAIVFGVVDVFYLVLHKPVWSPQWLKCIGWIVCASLLIYIYRDGFSSVWGGDIIEGTLYTRAQLSKRFPFGYAVFFFGQNRILSDEVVTNGLMEWTLDEKHVSIEPDVQNRVVQWNIPQNNITSLSPHVHIQGGSISMTSPFKTGLFVRSRVLFVPNKPLLYIGTLSDDQRFPVFVIGFRIPEKDEH